MNDLKTKKEKWWLYLYNIILDRYLIPASWHIIYCAFVRNFVWIAKQSM